MAVAKIADHLGVLPRDKTVLDDPRRVLFQISRRMSRLQNVRYFLAVRIHDPHVFATWLAMWVHFPRQRNLCWRVALGSEYLHSARVTPPAPLVGEIRRQCQDA